MQWSYPMLPPAAEAAEQGRSTFLAAKHSHLKRVGDLEPERFHSIDDALGLVAVLGREPDE
jgi:hypothetical protein